MNEENALVPVEAETAIMRPAAIEALGGNPEQMIEKATGIANALKGVITKAKLCVSIQGRDHVMVEGWTVMLSMLQVYPQVEWTRKIDDEDCTYEARVRLVHMPSGRLVCAADAMARASEKPKGWGRDEFSVRSMAQTRATGKAARLGFSWIVRLAGYEPTPAEEMDPLNEDSEEKADPACPSCGVAAIVLMKQSKFGPFAGGPAHVCFKSKGGCGLAWDGTKPLPAPQAPVAVVNYTKTNGEKVPITAMQDKHLANAIGHLTEELAKAETAHGNTVKTLDALEAEKKRRLEEAAKEMTA